MTRRRLDWLLQARGTDLAAWPDAERRAALALLRRSKVAQQALADVLAREDLPELDTALLARMQQGLKRALAPQPAVVRGMGWSALAACAAAGLYLGMGMGMGVADPETSTLDLFTQAQTVSFASLDQ